MIEIHDTVHKVEFAMQYLIYKKKTVFLHVSHAISK